jgi:hypothetical protein
MDKHIKNLLYLSEYKISNTDKKVLKEEIENLAESKQTEQQAINYLVKNTNYPRSEQEATSLVSQFKEFDTSQNQKNLPIIAAAAIEHPNMNDLASVFRIVGDFMNQGKLKPVQYTKNGYVIGDKTFKDWLKFSEYIHGLEHMSSGKKDLEGKINLETSEKPIWSGNGISIYDGNDVGRCIKYTTGGLTGQRYGFCIGQPANTMWQSYRDQKGSTFYYITDENRELNDPLHIIVLDHTQHGIELTDANNTTGTIAEYGTDVNGYVEYLKSKGAPVDKLINLPKTPEEEAETAKLGSSNEDLNWFKDLSYEEKSKYIGRGHLLGDEQFKYLWQYKNDKGGYKLLHQYLDTGQAIPEPQFNILIGSENG